MKVTGSIVTSILVIFENSQVHICNCIVYSCMHKCDQDAGLCGK